MTGQPISLDELDIIGYADRLAERKGPAVVPPVFRHRLDPERCFVPPFRIAGDWLIEPKCISFAEVRELEREERITLPKDFQRQARPEHQLWVDGDGNPHYETSTDAKRNLQRIYHQHLDVATAALREGKIDEAELQAGIALAANNQALEPRALIAACHVLKDERKQVVFIHKAVQAAGQDSELFGLLLKNYLEMVPVEMWETSASSVESALGICSAVGVEAWIPFRFTEAEYHQFRPLLHEFRRQGGEREFLIVCKGIEAVLMSERRSLREACADAKTWIRELEWTKVLAVAGETMVHAASDIAARCQSNPDRVRHLGQKVRQQISHQLVRFS